VADPGPERAERELHGWHIGDPRANDADKVANVSGVDESDVDPLFGNGQGTAA
jgi:hypothetical protein